MENLECDVAVVGLGPTGAILSNLLGQMGWSVIALERDEDIYYAPRAVHFDDEVLRIFQSAGLAETIAETSEAFATMEIALKAGADPVFRTKIGSQDARYGHPGAWWFHQPTLEAHLRAGLNRFTNVTSLLGVEVTALRQNGEAAWLTATLADGLQVTVKSKYLIGCDGGRSIVRKQANLALESADFDEAWVVVDTKTRSGTKDPLLPPNHRQICDPRQPVTYVPMAGPYYEWQFMVLGDKSEREVTDPGYVRQQLRHFVALDSVEITRIAYYKFHAIWAKKWRNGRIILAGDSAHQMPPFLGQGMCSGIRDAQSLSWRLDLLLAGRVGQSILDDYEIERTAHVRHIINGAMFLGRLIQTQNRIVAFLRNNLVLRPTNALPSLNRLLNNVANRKRPLQEGFLGAHKRSLCGRLLIQPEMSFGSERMLLDDALGQGFVLLLREGVILDNTTALAQLCSATPVRTVSFGQSEAPDVIDDMHGVLTRWFAKHQVDFVLIRPDRYIFDAGTVAHFAKVVALFCARFDSISGPVELPLKIAA